MAFLLFVNVLPESCNRENEQDGNENRDDLPKNHHPAAPFEISVVHHSQCALVPLGLNDNSEAIYLSPHFLSPYEQNTQQSCTFGRSHVQKRYSDWVYAVYA